jgi:hypothetical protein
MNSKLPLKHSKVSNMISWILIKKNLMMISMNSEPKSKNLKEDLPLSSLKDLMIVIPSMEDSNS